MHQKTRLLIASIGLTLGIGAFFFVSNTESAQPTGTTAQDDELAFKRNNADTLVAMNELERAQAADTLRSTDVEDSGNQDALQHNLKLSNLEQELLAEQFNQQQQSTTTIVANEGDSSLSGAEANGRPVINQEVHRAIQATIDQWQWAVNTPVRDTLNLAGLFEDPENDLLSVRVAVEADGLKITGYPLVNIFGLPVATNGCGALVVEASDSQNLGDDTDWVTTQFSLPAVDGLVQTLFPLEGETLYRLETTNNLAGKFTAYEVVYCQAFKFVNQQVYFAAAKDKTHCPSEEQLEPIGRYEIASEQQLVLTSDRSLFDATQTWTLKKQYDSVQQQGVTNYFVSVDNGRQHESYTMQKDKRAMEARINGVTGQYVFQNEWFDFLLPVNSEQYLMTKYANYIYDYKTEVAGPNGETTDSDLNLKAYSSSLTCAQVAPMFDNGVLGGVGKYGIDIISTNYPAHPAYSLDCFEFVSNEQTGQISLAFDLAYSPYEEFVPGEVYSYVLKPKPQFADRIEEIKLNLIYAESN
ncbi:hypothetical protein EGH82_20515 [Vibrio ponticus]|uniref:Uncharacterized protein n=1 Tax=Vibrio ponticus TaxID=265668 RepID=A0A3N3DU40_9VIBR|nr:hypothetical protein [Vibrio ponticus]ROV58003.1 hypothetical protein EGH82_20515 [Vibrio ponticus]